MGLLGAVVDAVTDEQGRNDTFRYRCVDCGETFERAKRRMVAVHCPSCSSRRVEAAERTDE
jgi:DNA-directed RNA polymerase subunit RPC12/RpoP